MFSNSNFLIIFEKQIIYRYLNRIHNWYHCYNCMTNSDSPFGRWCQNLWIWWHVQDDFCHYLRRKKRRKKFVKPKKYYMENIPWFRLCQINHNKYLFGLLQACGLLLGEWLDRLLRLAFGVTPAVALKYSIGPDGGPEETSWWSSTQVSEVSSEVSITLEKLLSLKM